jgi:hypothetical protein
LLGEMDDAAGTETVKASLPRQLLVAPLTAPAIPPLPPAKTPGHNHQKETDLLVLEPPQINLDKPGAAMIDTAPRVDKSEIKALQKLLAEAREREATLMKENNKLNKTTEISVGAEVDSAEVEDEYPVGDRSQSKKKVLGIIAAGLEDSDKGGNNSKIAAVKATGNRIKSGNNVVWYYCKVCEAYTLCRNCYDLKRGAEESDNERRGQKRGAAKRKRGGLRRGEEVQMKGACNHRTDGLRSEGDTRYLSWKRTSTMTAKYTKCEGCGDTM